MATRRIGGVVASAVGALAAVGVACELVGAGPRGLGVLGLAGDGITVTLALGLVGRRRGRVRGPGWVPVVRLAAVPLMNLSTLAGVVAVLVAALPSVRARAHGDHGTADPSGTPW